jgi:hypothetical protein
VALMRSEVIKAYFKSFYKTVQLYFVETEGLFMCAHVCVTTMQLQNQVLKIT